MKEKVSYLLCPLTYNGKNSDKNHLLQKSKFPPLGVVNAPIFPISNESRVFHLPISNNK